MSLGFWSLSNHRQGGLKGVGLAEVLEIVRAFGGVEAVDGEGECVGLDGDVKQAHGDFTDIRVVDDGQKDDRPAGLVVEQVEDQLAHAGHDGVVVGDAGGVDLGIPLPFGKVGLDGAGEAAFLT